MIAALSQVGWLARRAALRTLRRPTALYPALLFPLVLLIIITGGVGLASKLPGFPTSSYFAFALAGSFVQGALVGGINSGVDLAADIQSGFLTRLSLAPSRRWLLVIGQLCGSATLALVQALVYLAIAFAVGVRPAGGIGGVLIILALMVVMSFAFSASGAVLALRTKSSEAVLATFPITFILLLFSSFFMPRNLMSVAWFHAVATWNPVTYLIEAVRGLVIGGATSGGLLVGFLVAGVLAVITVSGATASFRAGAVAA
jgi:ABC-2 type transport system permease protein